MKLIKKIYHWCTKTRLRKILSLTLAILIFFTSIKYIFIPAPKVSAADVYIKFDEGYGTAPSDSNSAISAGTITNAVWKQEDLCKTGKCLYFDGTGDYVSFADTANLDFGPSNAFTLEGWFRTPDITSGQRTLIAKHNATAGGYKVYMDSSGYLVFGIDDDSTWTPDDTASTTTTAFDDNKWHFFSAVKTDSSITIYVDGKAYQTDSSLAATGTLANANTFYVGIDGNGSSNGFTGFLDEIRILKNSKTAAEVKADYTGLTSTTTGVGPVGWWKMDETSWTNNCSTSTAMDSSGNDLHLTACPSTTGPTGGSTGKFGNAGTFDGSDDYLESASTTLNIFPEVSVSVWVKILSTPAAEVMVVDRTNSNTGYYISYNTSNKAKFRIGTGSTYFTITGNTTIPNNAWTHLEGTADAKGNTTLYVNGIIDVTGSAGAPLASETGQNFRIGTRTVGTYANAVVDDVRVYNYDRTQTQVLEDMQGYPESGVAASFGPDQSYISNGLIGFWKMDESAANTCTGGVNDTCDYSGNTDNGAWGGNAANTIGKFGSGVTFDGTTDYISVTDNGSVLEPADDVTISFWANMTTLSRNNTLVAKDGVGGGGYYIQIDNGNTLQFGWRNSSSTLYTVNYSSSISQTSTWIHIVGVKSNNTIMLYVNGIAGSNKTTTTGTMKDTVDPLYLGAEDTTTNSMAGKLDDFRIFNRSLSSSEIVNLYRFAPGPIMNWSMDEGSWTNNCSTVSVFDKSGNGNNGTACPTTTGPIGGASGMFGKAGNFDGTEDYVNIPTFSGLPSGSGAVWTLSAWVKTTVIDGNNHIIMSYGDGLTTGASPHISLADTNKWRVSTWGTSTSVDSNTTPAINTWTHITGTSDGTVLRLYINGVLDNQGTPASNSPLTTNLRIGSSPRTTPTIFWGGTIDNAMIYNYTRTQSQIIEDMNGSHPAPGSPIGSPIAKWKMDEGYGTTAHDNSINENDLTLSTTSWTNSGKYGKAFNGLTNVRLSRTDDADLDFAASDDATFSVWFKSDSATNPSANEYILEKGGNITTDAIGYAIYTAASGGTICFGIDDDATSFPEDSVCSTNDLYDNTWHHIVAKKTGTSRLDLYVDGIANGTPDSSISATGTLENAATFYIGDTNGTDGTDEFLGDIDEVQVFRNALTEDQIKSLYNNASGSSLGSLSTDSSNNASSSDIDAFCPPGQGSACTAPVAYWKLDENTGTTANDSSGNSNTGTITPGIGAYNSGKVGSSYKFDGLETTINAGSGSTLDNLPATGMSVSAWIYPKSRGLNDVGAIVFKNNGINPNAGWYFRLGGTYNLTFSVDGSTDLTRFTENNAVVQNQWNHVELTWDGVITTASSVHIYVNGIEATYNTTTNGASRVDDGTSNLYIGNDSSLSRTFDGMIDDVKIYNYVRSPAQIAWEMNHGAPVAWWKFDECTGATANDSMGNTSTGTVVPGASGNTSAGSCSSGTSTDMWNDGTTGKYNGSLGFDGADDAVTISADTDLYLTTGGTITAWINPSTTGENSFGRIVDKSSDSAGTGGYIFGIDGNTVFGEMTNGSNLSCSSLASSVPFSQWSHVAWTFNGSNWNFYVNGALSDTCTTSLLPSSTSLGVTIGNRQGATDRTFDGLIDEVRIYNYPLTAQQIKTVMNNGAAVKYTQ